MTHADEPSKQQVEDEIAKLAKFSASLTPVEQLELERRAKSEVVREHQRARLHDRQKRVQPTGGRPHRTTSARRRAAALLRRR